MRYMAYSGIANQGWVNVTAEEAEIYDWDCQASGRSARRVGSFEANQSPK